MEPLLGMIVMFAGNFAPRGWAFCDGQLLPIAQYTALFSILGTTYGGDGRTTFALPDLRGRVPMHAGNGPGLTPRVLGQRLGTEHVTLTAANVPPHTHPLNATGSAPNDDVPEGRTLAAAEIYTSSAPNAALNPLSVGPSSGGGQPVETVPPVQVVNHIIALEGIFPSRG